MTPDESGVVFSLTNEDEETSKENATSYSYFDADQGKHAVIVKPVNRFKIVLDLVGGENHEYCLLETLGFMEEYSQPLNIRTYTKVC